MPAIEAGGAKLFQLDPSTFDFFTRKHQVTDDTKGVPLGRRRRLTPLAVPLPALCFDTRKHEVTTKRAPPPNAVAVLPATNLRG